MHHPIATRYSSPTDGRFHRRSGFDKDLRPGELSTAIARAKEGDREAVRYLYLRFAPNVYGYARSIVRDEHEAEDVTQQVFARLITALARYEERGVPFSAWILRITHNMAIDHMRRRLVLCDETSVAEEGDDDRARELSGALRDALEELPENQRQVLVMRHLGGYSPGEIAGALGRSTDSVHGLHHRGRRALKGALRTIEAAPMVAAA
jgi:RNA polymerase sigma-70 factor (ECF subfamily)